LPERPPYNQKRLPKLLFLGAGGMTLLTLALLWWQQPDLFLRTRLWLRTVGRVKVETAGMLRLPPDGPALLATDAEGEEARGRVVSAADRVTHFLVPAEGEQGAPEELLGKGRQVLAKGGVVAVSLAGPAGGPGDQLLRGLLAEGAPVL